MKRTRVLLDEPTYEAVKRRAFERRVSMSTVVREALRTYLSAPKEVGWRVGDLAFIGSGASDAGELAPLSVNHDEALARDLYEEHQSDTRGHVRDIRPGGQERPA
jgi:hypothetical protein